LLHLLFFMASQTPRNFFNGTNLSPEELRHLCIRYEKELVGVKDWMFVFLMAWTAVLWVMEWAQFFSARAIPHTMTAGYIVLLGAYIAHKEVLRWTGITARVRRGELFVYIWWGTFLLMFLVEYLAGRWTVPEGMTLLSYEILGYFVLSEVSKAFNAWRVAQREEGKGR